MDFSGQFHFLEFHQEAFGQEECPLFGYRIPRKKKQHINTVSIIWLNFSQVSNKKLTFCLFKVCWSTVGLGRTFAKKSQPVKLVA
jgi:hypothetical protein